jgi:hypothetical protein
MPVIADVNALNTTATLTASSGTRRSKCAQSTSCAHAYVILATRVTSSLARGKTALHIQWPSQGVSWLCLQQLGTWVCHVQDTSVVLHTLVQETSSVGAVSYWQVATAMTAQCPQCT